MSKRVTAVSIVFVAALAFSSVAPAQQTAPPPKPATAGPRVPMHVQFVLSKYQGEKKISSLPYTVTLNSSDPTAELRMGANVPIPTSVVKDGNAVQSYNYNQVGVTIRCSVKSLEDGLFSVDVSVEDSSVFMNPATGSASASSSAPLASGAPVFKNFRMNSVLLLKDGQTSQLIAAADPTSGDMMRIDVTLNLVK